MSMINEHPRDISFPLTGPQGWFFSENLPNPHHFNMGRLLEMPSATDPILVEQALAYLLNYHEELRTRFLQTESGWKQFIADAKDTIPFSQIDFSQLPSVEQEKALEEACEEAQVSLNLFTGPVIRVILFQFGSSRSTRFLIITHHLIADSVSFQIILEDMRDAYTQLVQGKNIHLLPRTTPLREYAKRVMDYVNSDTFKQEANYWFHMHWAKIKPLPVDFLSAKEANTKASQAFVNISLTAEETRNLLRVVPKTYHITLIDVLLTAFVQTFAQWTGVFTLQVSVIFNGRNMYTLFDDINLLRTIGFLACGTELLVLEIEEKQTTKSQLQSVHKQLLSMPHRGAGCQWLRYLCKDPDILRKEQGLPKHSVTFNYLGQERSTSAKALTGQQASTFAGTLIDPQTLTHALACYAIIVDNVLTVTWEYSKNMYRNITIETLAHSYMNHLRNFIQL